MKKIVLLLFIGVAVLTLGFLLNGQSDKSDKKYLKQLNSHREEKNEEFKKDKDSPLTNKQKKKFEELNYFEPSLKYKVKAQLQIFDLPENLTIKTSQGGERYYLKYAKASFSLNGEDLSVLLLKSDQLSSKDKNKLYLLFTDDTSGKETYGGGRYVDMDYDGGKFVDIDFNYAYNPYCAYNSNYDCAIPPSQNHITVPIKAGEKVFKSKSKH